MTSGLVGPATLPPPGLVELDPAWSRLVTVPGLDGVGRTFHLLDNKADDPEITLLCVHGNPSWSYLWRRVIAKAGPGVRVIALDHLDMGFSERTGRVRRLEQRIDDLCALTDHLDLKGPVVTVAHDWGGPISLGWAHRHREQLAGIVLSNTAVHQPSGSSAPGLIRFARIAGLHRAITVQTSTFVRAALALSRPRPAKEVRDAYLAPYLKKERRSAVGGFLDDAPLNPSHPSFAVLAQVAAALDDLRDVPALILWGSSDPVFSDIYLHDLEARLPQADVHRFVGAGHYVHEDADVAGAVIGWVAQITQADQVRQETIAEPGSRPMGNPLPADRMPMWHGLDQRADDAEVALIEMTPRGPGRSMSFAELGAEVRLVATGLHESGVRNGDRVALLVPPGVDLTVCVYACWRMGAVVVFADAGLGVRGMGHALASAAPEYLIGVTKALAAAKVWHWPGRRIAVSPLSGVARRALAVEFTLDDLRRLGEGKETPPSPSSDDPAAVIFTSGATGPSKGVRYRHRQAQEQRDTLMQVYGIGPKDRLVAAFAPFALYGPAMGIPSVVPNMDPTSPGTLRAPALAEAVEAIGASIVFASPAALTNVAATSSQLTTTQYRALSGVRLLMSAGAPVSSAVLHRVVEIMPAAEAHTPYGMTEVLPVADIGLADIDQAGERHGVCVGRPVAGVAVAIDPLDELGQPRGVLTSKTEVTGEVVIRANHAKDGYDRLWVTQHASAQPAGWHRSGDVGHLDATGRLWIEGRLGHVITSGSGPVTPVAIERSAESLPSVDLAAAVGIGPPGTQVVVVVIAPSPRPRRPDLAPESLADQVRAVAGVDIAAVLVVPALPVDIRHNSKIDRTRIAAWASSVLAGGRLDRL